MADRDSTQMQVETDAEVAGAITRKFYDGNDPKPTPEVVAGTFTTVLAQIQRTRVDSLIHAPKSGA